MNGDIEVVSALREIIRLMLLMILSSVPAVHVVSESSGRQLKMIICCGLCVVSLACSVSLEK